VHGPNRATYCAVNRIGTCLDALVVATLALMVNACEAEPPGSVPPVELEGGEADQPGQAQAQGQGQDDVVDAEPGPPDELPAVYLDPIDTPTKWQEQRVFGDGPPHGFVNWGTVGGGVYRKDLGDDGEFCVMIPLNEGGDVTATFEPTDQWGRKGKTETRVITQEGETPP
jgi:hypothetical protein